VSVATNKTAFWIANGHEVIDIFQRVDALLEKTVAAGVSRPESAEPIRDILQRLSSPTAITVVAEAATTGNFTPVGALVPPGTRGHELVKKITMLGMLLKQGLA